MMIGGEDIRVEVPIGAVALDFAVRLVRLRWPKAVFVANDDPRLVGYQDLEFHERSEVIIYKDRESAEAWDTLGYHDSLKGTMIYLISDPSDLTLVVENDRSAEIQLIVDAVVSGLPSAFLRLQPLKDAA